MPDLPMKAAPPDQDDNEEYAFRPRNHGKTFLFSDLHLTLFNPLNENKKKPSGPAISRKKTGPNHASASPSAIRRAIVERFIARWRADVGDDIYPAFRLIIPEKDRERAMYGLKEKTIGKLLVHIVKIDKNSEDGFNLLNWKLPGGKFRASSMVGDFAGRCYEVLTKRAMRSKPGDMTIAEVNELLDRLSFAQKEEHQLPIMQEFYQRMNAEELMWLIRMILRQMKIGATERTIFDIWHPDAETLYNVSSSLKRVCWELTNPEVRLQGGETDIQPMECFQPQLAQFQMHSFDKMLQRLHPTDDDNEFWIEEKLDGERMQLHMVEDPSLPGGRRFRFWSRKAKDYTDLYGSHLEDQESALTQHLRPAFNLDEVRNIILDGEMITWDSGLDMIVPFGTLKTAALEQKKNSFAKQRPLFRVFDILFLNDTALDQWTLRDRRRALDRTVTTVHRRLEIHKYTPATTAQEIEDLLRKVVEEASEGLVVKNPRSMYRLNERNDDWIKVKPEYMTEYGESLDCVVIGGYYGSGHRGGNISSYLCGLRVDQTHLSQGEPDLTCYSFFKVGGGFTAADYQAMRHHTEGKWHEWDRHNPPSIIKLGGGDRQYERPDVWIRPDESVVIEAKAASVGNTDQFALGITLRFPRFKRLRMDKSWKEALSIQEFKDLRGRAEQERIDKQFTVDNSRKRARTGQKKKALVIAGTHDASAYTELMQGSNLGEQLKVLFEGLTFHVMTESLSPSPKHPKAYLEGLIKAHGGSFVQKPAGPDIICIADRNQVAVASLKKQANKTIVRSIWLFDCIMQAGVDVESGKAPVLLPWEGGRHTFFVREDDAKMTQDAVDRFGDGYARDVTGVHEMRDLLNSMPDKFEDAGELFEFKQLLTERGHDFGDLPGWIFSNCVGWMSSTRLLRMLLPLQRLRKTAQESPRLGNLWRRGSHAECPRS
ncbi:hypothetical protein FH972_024297 [Carpinus fangiana]|uniref:DNA ligase n=1 Tax=Carpinus fangiana TaxID=176857 RepID=A0A5N6KYJ0_9ROSI|nr:hypothetical protein FH972_024297 [Carpinus fangiana]